MERAIKDLCQLGDTGFFKEVATGISHVVANVERLDLAGHETRKPVAVFCQPASAGRDRFAPTGSSERRRAAEGFRVR